MYERISQDPAIKFGKPCIRGTRITVEMILRLMGKGWSNETLLEEYPGLVEEDILAALSFGADYIAHGHKAEAA
jgi:uncharacterized protein (DUF433 family)